MSDTFNELISVAIDLKNYFQIYRFEVCYDRDGSYIDLSIARVVDLPRVDSLVKGLKLSLLPQGDRIIVRVYERGNS